MVSGLDLMVPDWPAPQWVRAFSTGRAGGVSEGEFESLNLGLAVGDNPARVARNRQLALGQQAGTPVWLEQVHGVQVAALNGAASLQPTADASWTGSAGLICLVQTADCLPLLVCDQQSRRVAAIHAGWRGLAGGVIEATLSAMAANPSSTMVWLGPAIGPEHFEVGADVLAAFCQQQSGDRQLFVQTDPQHWLADLPGLAQRRLERAGFEQVYASGLCTFALAQRFFSYRRDGQTGRMASGISIAG